MNRLAMPIISRNKRGGERADDAAAIVQRGEAALEGSCCGGDGDRGEKDDGGVPKREEEAGGVGRLALLHQFADDVVDGGDMVGVECVPETKDIGE